MALSPNPHSKVKSKTCACHFLCFHTYQWFQTYQSGYYLRDCILTPCRRLRSAIAMQPCELFVIPCSLFFPLLSATQVRSLKRQISDQQLLRQGRLAGVGKDGGASGGKAVQWPQAAGVLREYLKALPGSRPAWQVMLGYMLLLWNILIPILLDPYSNVVRTGLHRLRRSRRPSADSPPSQSCPGRRG